MAYMVMVRDESTSGSRTDAIELSFPTEQITVRELIRERIYQEVEDHNRGDLARAFKGLVKPEAAEEALNGAKPRKPVNWKAQFEKAIDAYERNRILVLVGDRQTESLDEVVTLTRGVDVTFLKLVPLVGG